MRKLLVIQIAIVVSLGLPSVILAQTPPTPQVQAEGLRHRAQVFDRYGQIAVDESTFRIYPRPDPRQGPRQDPSPCAQGTVSGGVVEIVPVFTANCPENMPVSIVLDLRDGQTPIVARSEPPFEWRAARAGEPQKVIVVKPPLPPTADAPAGTQPVPQRLPLTGSGWTEGETTGFYLGIAAVTVGALSLLVSFAPVRLRRHR